MSESHFTFDLVECLVEEQPPPTLPQQSPEGETPPSPTPPPPVQTPIIKDVKVPSVKKPKPPPPNELAGEDTEKVLSRLPDRKLPPPIDNTLEGFGERSASSGTPTPQLKDIPQNSTSIPFPPLPVPPKTEEQRLEEEAELREKEKQRKERMWKDRSKVGKIEDDQKRQKEEDKLKRKEEKDQKKLDQQAEKDALVAQQKTLEQKQEMERQLARNLAEAERQRNEEKKLRIVSCCPTFLVSDEMLGGEEVKIAFSHKPTKADSKDQEGWWEPLISPQPNDGKWILEGNSFVYKKATPWNLSTEYAISLPSPADKIISANNEHISENSQVSFKFNTPCCKVISITPQDGSQGIDPSSKFTVTFDQVIDCESSFKLITLQNALNSNDKKAKEQQQQQQSSFKLKLIPNESKTPSSMISFIPEEPLPHNLNLELVIPQGIISLLGPCTSNQQTISKYTTAERFTLITGRLFQSSNSSNPIEIHFTQPLYLGNENSKPKNLDFQEPIIIPKPPQGGKWDYKSNKVLIYTPGAPGWTNSTIYKIDFSAKPDIRSAFGEYLPADCCFINLEISTVKLVRMEIPTCSLKCQGKLISKCPILLVFDQKIDKMDTMSHLYLKLGKKAKTKLIMLEMSTLQKLFETHLISESDMNLYSKEDPAKCLLVSIDPTTPNLPPSTNASIRISAGVRSIEGPEKSTMKQKKYFITANDFILSSSTCNVSAQSKDKVTFGFSHEINVEKAITELQSNRTPITTPKFPKGIWKFVNSFTLEFAPNTEEVWNGSTEYKVDFSPLLSAFGEMIKEPIFTFKSSLLSITEFIHIPYMPDKICMMPCMPVGFKFNQKINQQLVLSHLKARSTSTNEIIPLRLLTSLDIENLNQNGLFHFSTIQLPSLSDSKSLLICANNNESGFPFNTQILFEFDKEVPSVEGPILTNLSMYKNTVSIAEEFNMIELSPNNDMKSPLSLGSRQKIHIKFNRELPLSNPIPENLVPIIEPMPPKGTWVFESPYILEYIPTENWNGSTEYHVIVRSDISKGIKSIFNELIKPQIKPNQFLREFTFQTVRINVTSFIPIKASVNHSYSIQHAPIFITFDQRIDHQAMLSVISAKANNKTVPLKLLTQLQLTDLIQNGRIKPGTIPANLLTLDSNYWIAIICDSDYPFPSNSIVNLTIGPNIPSAEGALLSVEKYTNSFQIGPDFKVIKGEFSQNGTPRILEIEFNQPLVGQISEPLQWTPEITPKIEGNWAINPNSTSNLTFKPTTNWINSTLYTVAVQSGSISWFSPESTKENWSYKFETPRIDLISMYPMNGWQQIPVQSPFVFVFNQKVNPEKIIPKLTVRYSKLKIPIQHKSQLTIIPKQSVLNWVSAMPQFVKDSLNSLFRSEFDGFWFAAQSSIPLPFDNNCSIILDKGYPSEEGPLLSLNEINCSFSTCEQFKINEKESTPNNNNMKISDMGNIKISMNHSANTNRLDGTFTWSNSIIVNPTHEIQWTTSCVDENHYLITGNPLVNWVPSTLYTVTIPSGTISGFGQPLEKDFVMKFTTRTLQIHSAYPQNSIYVKSETPIFIQFDQKISKTEVLKYIKLEYSDWDSEKHKPIIGQFSLVDSIESIRSAGIPESFIASIQPERFLCFNVTPALPPQKIIHVLITNGTPSAEGPLKLSEELSFSFLTYQPFQVHYFSHAEKPGDALFVSFSQPLIQTDFDPKSMPPNSIPENAKFVPAGNANQRILSKIHLTPPEANPGEWVILESDSRLAKYNPHEPNTFPHYSTTYQLSIESGGVSGLGSIMTTPYTTNFTTQYLSLVWSYPTSNALLDTPIFLMFNQPIDPNRAISTISIWISGNKTKKPFCNPILLSNEEITNQIPIIENEGKHIDNLRNIIAFKCDKQLPSTSTIDVKIGPNTPVLDGPNTISNQIIVNFRTICRFGCDSVQYIQLASPLSPFVQFKFTQPLAKTVESLPEWVPTFDPQIENDILGLRLDNYLQDLHCYSTDSNKKLLQGSTKYQITLPEQIKSAWNVLIEGQRVFNFITQTNGVDEFLPPQNSNLNGIHTLIFIRFNQPFDLSLAAKYLKIQSVHIDSRVKIMPTVHQFTVLTNRNEVSNVSHQQRSFIRTTKSWPDGKWIALKPKEPLPFASEITVRVAKKLPSSEGPLLSPEKIVFKFTTRPMTIISNTSPQQGAIVAQGTPLHISFSESINISQLKSAITISPPLPFHLRSSHLGKFIEILGTTPSGWCNWNSKHIVNISGNNLTDIYGQQLKTDTHFEITLTPTTFETSLFCPYAPNGSIITYDPFFSQTASICVKSKNYTELRVVLYKFNPQSDLNKWPGNNTNVEEETKMAAGGIDYLRFGKKVYDEVVFISGFAKNTEVTSWIPLHPALEEGRVGQIGIIILPTKQSHQPNPWTRNSVPIIKLWIQVTHLALDIFHDLGGVTIWCTDIETGSGVKNVNVNWSHNNNSKEGITNDDGIAMIQGENNTGNSLFIATHGKDCVFMRDNSTLNIECEQNKTIWHVFDDRSMYRPNEDVHIKGYVKNAWPASAPIINKVKIFNPCKQTPYPLHIISYKIIDSRGSTILTSETTEPSTTKIKTNAWGSFDFCIHLPDNVNLGEIKIELALQPPEESLILKPDTVISTHTHKFTVQEFRRPDFIVDVKPLSTGPHWYLSEDEDGGIVLRCDVSYFTGGHLADANVDWQVVSSRGTYIPPGLSDFSFENNDIHPDSWFECKKTLKGKTLDDGKHHTKVVFRTDEQNPPQSPLFLDATASVLDLSNQTITASTRITVHPCSYCIGIALENDKTHTKTLPNNETRIFRVVVSNHDGKAIADIPIKLEFGKEGYMSDIYNATSQIPYLSHQVKIGGFGVYSLTATVQDDFERIVTKKHKITIEPTIGLIPISPPTRPSLSVIPKKQPKDNKLTKPLQVIPEAPHIEEQKLDLTVNYQGEIAEIVIRAPFISPRTGVLCVVGQGILRVIPFSMTTQEHHLQLPLPSEWLPRVHLWVSVVGSDGSNATATTPTQQTTKRTAFGSSDIECNIPISLKTLAVTPSIIEEFVEPGAETTITVEVKDKTTGKPSVGAEVSLIVVDESILALTKYTIPDPIKSFWVQTLFGTSPKEKQSSRKGIALIPSDIHRDLNLEETIGLASITSSTGHTAAALESFTHQSGSCRTEVPVELYDDGRESIQCYSEHFGNAAVHVSIRIAEVGSNDPNDWIKIVDNYQPPNGNSGLGFIFMFNLLDIESFESLLSLNPLAQSKPTIVVGTSIDKFEERQVEFDDAVQFARRCMGPYFEINSSNNDDVHKVLASLVRDIFAKKSKAFETFDFLIFGKLGSGKSTFINKASGDKLETNVIPPDQAISEIIKSNPLREIWVDADRVILPTNALESSRPEEIDFCVEEQKQCCEPLDEQICYSAKKKKGGGLQLPGSSRTSKTSSIPRSRMAPPKRSRESSSLDCAVNSMSMPMPQMQMQMQMQMMMPPPAPCCAAPMMSMPTSADSCAMRGPPPSTKLSRTSAVQSKKKDSRSRSGGKEKEKCQERRKCEAMEEEIRECADDADENSESADEEDEDDNFLGEMKEEEKAEEKMAEEKEEEEAKTPLTLRSNFNALANFTPSIPTNSNGIVTIPVHFPDSIAKYRIWAVSMASEGGACGLGETSIVARLPLLVRTTAPRFLSFGDTSRISVIVQNMTPKDRSVKVAIESTENIQILPSKTQKSGLIADVPAMGRRIFPFTVYCSSPGKATFAISCVSGVFGDAQKITVPIYPPPLTSSPELQGSFDGLLTRIPLSIPTNSIFGFGSFELSVSTSTISGTLGSISLHLNDVINHCESTEELSSAIWGLTSLLRSAISIGIPEKALPVSTKLMNLNVTKLVKILKDRQYENGCFSNWPISNSQRQANIGINKAPLFSVLQIALCAAELCILGQSIPSKILERSRNYIQKLISEDATGYNFADSELRAPTIAFGIHVLHQLWKACPPTKKEKEAQHLKSPIEFALHFWKTHSPQDLPIESISWILFVIGEKNSEQFSGEETTEELLAFFGNAVELNEITSSFYEPLIRSNLLHSPMRTMASVLSAFSHIHIPTSNDSIIKIGPVINKIVEMLTKYEHWSSPHEAGWAAHAISEYLFDVSSKNNNEKVDCSVSAWISSSSQNTNTIFCGTTPRFLSSASNASQSAIMKVPLSVIPKSNETNNSTELLVGKEGTGRVYFFMRLKYAPNTPEAPSYTCGFSISREYTSQKFQETQTSTASSSSPTHEEDVKFDSNKNMWSVKSGVVVNVVIKIKTNAMRWNVAVVDKLPAGFEPILKQQNEEENANKWCEHINIRDERAEAFAQQLPIGEYVFKYQVRASTIGEYNVNPCRASDMYQPEIFGQCSSSKVQIIESD